MYLPLLLVAVFLVGSLSFALLQVRTDAGGMSHGGSVSDSDAGNGGRKIRKSRVMEDAGLRYRMVSAADLDIEQEDTSQKDRNAPVHSAVSSEEETVSSEETAVSSEEETASETPDVSSEEELPPVSSEEPEPIHLELPNDHYINFFPQKKEHVVYLTFDDGPSENTADILDILDYYGVKATFFVIYHKNMADQYKAIVNGGHTIGLLTSTKKYDKIYASETAYFNELSGIQSYVRQVTGVRSKIIRFPGGSSNTVSNRYCQGIMKTLKKSVVNKGYIYHDWNLDIGDANGNNISRDKLVQNVKDTLTKYRKVNILMHDGGASKRTTVEALPEIIEYIYSQGYAMEGITKDSYAVHH